MVVDSMHLLQVFYPNHYREKIPLEFQAIQDLLNYWYEFIVIRPYERYLNQLILSTCSDTTYMNTILQTMGVQYLDESQIQFMMARKRVLSIPKLVDLIIDYFFPENEIDFDEEGCYIRIRFENAVDYTFFDPFIEFLHHYLIHIIPVNQSLYLDGYAIHKEGEKEKFTNTISYYNKEGSKIQMMTGYQIRYFRYHFVA